MLGTYRLDYDFLNSTNNQGVRNLSSGNRSYWWAFHSMCTAAGCAATGASLDAANHKEPEGLAAVFHFDEGHWRDNPSQFRATCGSGRRAGTATDENTVSSALDLAPRTDGTVTGVETQTTMSNECGFKGLVNTIPVVGTRTGPLPPNAVLADPAFFVS